MLVELDELGMIEAAPDHGMRITDMKRLEALSDEIADPLLQSDLPDAERQLPIYSKIVKGLCGLERLWLNRYGKI